MAIGICPQINLHFHNENGTGFAANYRLYVYENETTTPRISYTDYTGVSEHTQPIIIQPDGKVPGEGLFLSDEYTYTLLLCDEYDAPIDTLNGINISDIGGDEGVVEEVIGSTYIEVDSTDPTAPIVSTTGLATEEALEEKVDKIDGMGLSTNDYTDIDKAKVDNLPDDTNAELDLKIDISEMGVADGVATLDSTGKVPTSQLSGTVATVQEAYVVGSTPFTSTWLSETSGGAALTPSDSVIYYILTAGDYENKEYRWGGTYYVELSESLVLGNTSSTAFQGDFGEVAWEHTFDVTTNPHAISATTIGLENVDNTSDADKPVSDAAQLLFDGTVNTTGDQSVSGIKYFSDRITMHDGLLMDSYELPSGGSTPDAGQVLKFPETGNVLEWADTVDGEDVVAATGYAYTARVTDDDPGTSWYNTLVISEDNDLLDTKIDSDDNFDKDTGIFTAPETGYYYVQAQANVKSAYTGSTTEETDVRLQTYIQQAGIPYFTGTNTLRGVYNRSLGCSSAGILYMTEGDTVFGVAECNVSASYTPTTYSIAAYMYRCSVSFHKLATRGAKGADGEGGVVSVNSELPDTAGNIALTASLIPTDDSDVQTEIDTINETLSNLESATGSFTYDTLLLTTTEQSLALTLVTQSSNTDIFEIDDADDTLNIKEVSNYINTVNFVLSKTAALSVDMTYRIYDASGVEYFSEVITLVGNGTLTPSLTIDVKDRPIGEYYATIELDNTAGVYLQSSTNVTVVTTSVNSSLLYPPTITLSNIDSVTNTFGLLYKIASTTVSKPSYRDSQISQFDNSDCDPSISAGGRIRSISIHSAAMAVSTATVATTVYARVGVYSILTNANGGPILLGEYDIPITPNANIGIYNDTGTPNGTKGSLSLDLSVPAGTLLGFQLINSSAFTGDNEYINAFRNTFVGISIY